MRMEVDECINVEKTAISSLAFDQKSRAQSVPPTLSADIFGNFPRSTSSLPEALSSCAVTTTRLECQDDSAAVTVFDKKSVDAILVRSMSEMRRIEKSKIGDASGDDDDGETTVRMEDDEDRRIQRDADKKPRQATRGRGRRKKKRGGDGPRKRPKKIKEPIGIPTKKRKIECEEEKTDEDSGAQKSGGDGEKRFILITRGGGREEYSTEKKKIGGVAAQTEPKKIANGGGAGIFPPSFAGELRTKLIADSSDPDRVIDRMLDQGLVVPNDVGVGVHVNTQILLSALPGKNPALLTTTSGESSAAAVAESRELVKIENPAGALTVRASADLTLAVDVSTRILLTPTAPRTVAKIGTHACTEMCVYHRATEKCGLRGCEPLAIQFERQIGSRLPSELRDTIRPEDVWICEKSGALHVCTRELCDSLDPNKQRDQYVCRKTGLEHGQIMVPPSDSFFDGKFYPSAEVARVKDDGYMRQVARPATGAWLPSCSAPWQRVRLAGTDRDPRRANGYYRRHKFRSNLLKKQDKVKGRTACLVAATLNSRAERAFPGSDPSTISADKLASAEATERLREIDTIFASDPKKKRDRQLLRLLPPAADSEKEKPVRRIAAAPSTSTEVIPAPEMAVVPKKDEEEFSEDDSESTASARLMPSAVACYRRAYEMAAVTVVILPVVLKVNPALSSDRQRQCAERYGTLIWRGWTLVAGSPTSESQDAEVKFRHFSLGIIYQAKYGFSVSFDLRSVPEYRFHRAAIDAAVRVLVGANAGNANEMETFARRNAIRFLNAESYLDARLVQENKIGMKNTTIDGIPIESVGVNAGIRLVKDGLSAIAEWAKKRFIADVVAGVDAHEALRRARVRARAMLVTPPLPQDRKSSQT